MRGCHVTYLNMPSKNDRFRRRRQAKLRTIARNGYSLGFDIFTRGWDLWELGINWAPHGPLTPGQKEEWTNYEANILNGFLDAAEKVGKTTTLDW